VNNIRIKFSVQHGSSIGSPYIIVVVVESEITKFYGFINNSFHSTTNDGFSCVQGDDLVIGNVGDSRAVLARRTDDDEMEAIQLTVDLKPNLPSMIYVPCCNENINIRVAYNACQLQICSCVFCSSFHFRRSRTNSQVQGSCVCTGR
jgi:hypothetical protein